MTTRSVEFHGECDARFAAIREAFAENFQKFGEVGAAVAVIIDCTPVGDIWGGVVDTDTNRPCERVTIITVDCATEYTYSMCCERLVFHGTRHNTGSH